MSEEATLNEFVSTDEDASKEDTQDVAIGNLQQLEESPIERWELVKLRDILSLEYGNNLPSDSRADGDIPVYGSNGQVDTHNESAVNSPGIVLGRKGSIGEIQFSDESFWPIDTTYYITANQTDQNLRFLYYLLQNIQLERLNAASAIPGLNRNDAYGLNALTPPLPEQRKIATVLYTVDQAIEKTEEIIKQSELLRTGIMQDLFSTGVWTHDEFQETQYGSIPVEWKVKTIDDISNRIGSGGTPNTDEDAYYGGNISWIKTDDLNSGLVETTKTKITEEGLNESAAKLFPEGTVVFAMYGGALGQNGRLGMEATMNQACCGIVTDESKIDPYFLHQQLIHRKQQLTALSAGTHQQNISQSMIEKFEVFVPSLEEQSKIVEILQDIETMIDKSDRQKNCLHRLKCGLMQDLLSGTVRTTDTNIEVPGEIAQYG